MKYVAYFLVLFVTTLNFAHADEDRPGVVMDLLIRSGDDWTGAPLPPYLQSAPQIAVMRFTIAPNVSLPIHKHPAINAGYILDGELTVVQEGGIQKTYKKGDALIEMVDKWHHGFNPGTVPTELVVFYATTKDMPLAIRKSAP